MRHASGFKSHSAYVWVDYLRIYLVLTIPKHQKFFSKLNGGVWAIWLT